MGIKDYSIIETEWIDNWIKTYEDLKYKSALPNGNGQDIITYEKYRNYIYILKEMKSKLKPLIPIVEIVWNEGQTRSLNMTLEHYINNTIIE